MVILLMFRVSTELMLTVIQARDLERDHVTGSLDSYIRVSLAPFTGSRSQTRVRKYIYVSLSVDATGNHKYCDALSHLLRQTLLGISVFEI